MFQILYPSIIHIFTPISFPQLLILFLVQPHILMETLKFLSLLFHIITFMIYQSIFNLISYLGRCYITLELIYMIHITILQLYKELIVLLVVLIFVLFGKDYAHIYFPFQILFSYHSLLVARSILIMLLLHQMMRYKVSLLFFLADSTLQRMIMEFTTSSSILVLGSLHLAHSSEQNDMLNTCCSILCLVLS